MKEAIRMVPSSIYDPKLPDTSHFRAGLGCHSALRRIKEEWGTSHLSSRWFLEFDIRQSFDTIDRHRLISILKEEIDDPKFFDSIHQVFSAGRLIGSGKGVPHSVLLSALLSNIYLHKFDQEIARIQQKYEMPLVQRLESVLVKPPLCDYSPIDDQEKESFKTPQDKRDPHGLNNNGKAALHSPLSSRHTLPTSTVRLRQKRSLIFSPFFLFPSTLYPGKRSQKAALATFLNKPSSLLFPALLISFPLLARGWLSPMTSFFGREGCHNHGALRDLFPSYKGRGLLIELDEAARLIIRSEKGLASKPPKSQYSIRISYARYANDFLLGIVGAAELLVEIEKRIAHFLESGLNLELGSVGSITRAARTSVEFLGMVIREVPPKTTATQFLRELEKRLRVKDRIHLTACHLRSAIHRKFRNLGQTIIGFKPNSSKELTKEMSKTGSLLLYPDRNEKGAESLGRARLSSQVNLLCTTVKDIRQGSRESSLLDSSGQNKVPSDIQAAVSQSGMRVRKCSLYTLASRKVAGEGRGQWARSISGECHIHIEAPIKKIVRRLRDRGLLSRRRPWPIHVACLTNVSDEDIVNWSAGIAISPLSYYRCRDNLYQVRTLVDHQIRWSAIFTLAHKHKASAQNIIPKYSKDSKIVNREGGQTLAEFPNSLELRKVGSGERSRKRI